MTTSTPHPPARKITGLREDGFPLDELSRHPVSAIESMAATVGLSSRPVCDVGCLACCTNSIRTAAAGGHVAVLNPHLLSAILSMASDLSRSGIHLISTDRFNLFSGSNEIDHPDCVELREILSGFFEQVYGRPLGSISSDVVFHVSGSPYFRHNLQTLATRPLLWDNICVAIDEQIGFSDAGDYRRYLEDLAYTWKILHPALAMSLPHSRGERSGEPRVILNMLIPGPGSEFDGKHRTLYPGGPPRATTFAELIRRYVVPFGGEIRDEAGPVPKEHRFTTSIAGLKSIPGSKVFVGRNYFAPAGRARQLIRFDNPAPRIPAAIRTKILPVSQTAFRISAAFTTSPASEEEIPARSGRAPAWFDALRSFVIEVS